MRFEAHRDHLLAVAYRLLGSRTDAEDAVQEAWLRWHATDQAEVRDVRAWLTTVTARICLDQLRSARVRRESYVGQWLPEPAVDPDLPGQLARTEQVSYALLVVLERLSPQQRVAMVLHDVFAVPFDAIAPVLGTTAAAARQLAARARQAVTGDGAPRHTADLAEQRRVVTAFLAAARSGDLDGLLAVLAPEAVMVSDSNGIAPTAPQPVVGAVAVARLLTGLARLYGRKAARFDTDLVGINGDLGLRSELEFPDGTVLPGVTAFAIADGRITRIFTQLNPAKLPPLPPPTPLGWAGGDLAPG